MVGDTSVFLDLWTCAVLTMIWEEGFRSHIISPPLGKRREPKRSLVTEQTLGYDGEYNFRHKHRRSVPMNKEVVIRGNCHYYLPRWLERSLTLRKKTITGPHGAPVKVVELTAGRFLCSLWQVLHQYNFSELSTIKHVIECSYRLRNANAFTLNCLYNIAKCMLAKLKMHLLNTRTGEGSENHTAWRGGGAYNAPPSISAPMRASATNFEGYIGPY